MSNHISARKRQLKRPYATRKPRDYMAKKPGDIVGVDILDVRPLLGVTLSTLPLGISSQDGTFSKLILEIALIPHQAL